MITMTISITIPLNEALITLGLFLLAPLICALTTLTTERWYSRTLRKSMNAREKALNDRAIRVLSREERVQRFEQLEEREERVTVRENAIETKAHRLGKAVQDMRSQTNLALHQSAEDTEISIPRWEELTEEPA